ncbi:MAG: hypothetical protein ACRD19_11155 [Terriglobia bacterium]
MKIESKTGVYMAPLTTLARLRVEQEVLFGPCARLLVKRISAPNAVEPL